jgi:hypothetical protein
MTIEPVGGVVSAVARAAGCGSAASVTNPNSTAHTQAVFFIVQTPLFGTCFKTCLRFA